MKPPLPEGYLWEGEAVRAPNNALLRLDFLDPALQRRCAAPGRYQEPLARACGITPTHPVTLIDATAGWGREAFFLAHLGAQVILIERHPLLQAMLRQALEHPLATGMQLHCGESIQLLAQLPCAQVIYLDPMFDLGTYRQGAVKAPMRFMRDLVGPGQEDEALLSAARAAARRVVMKRCVRSSLGPGVSYSVPAGKIRFDVYWKATAD